MAALLSKRIIKPWLRRVHTKTTLVSNRIIKPCSATPESLRCYNLSSSDQSMPSFYIPLAFFYPAVRCRFGSRSQISQQIENSLSKTLAYYYPFAGRLVGNVHVSCNDAGVEFREVRINRPMSEILRHTHSFAEDAVFPRGLSWSIPQNVGKSLVVIQVNYFDCGGLAIAACISHKIADGSTVASFLSDLASTCRQSDHIPSPQYVANTIFPPMDHPLSDSPGSPTSGVSRRYVFRSAEIEKLKAMAFESGVEKPTRVEVVTALLYQRALASSRADSGSVGPSILFQTMNLRPVIGFPLQHNSVGNIFAGNILVTEDNRMSFPELVSELRNAKVKLQNFCKQKLNTNSSFQDMLRDLQELRRSYDVYATSSICRFPFYGVDFGWGKPIRVCLGQYPTNDTFLLMDTPGNGIEAQVILEERKMSTFEHDEDILSFVSSHPTEKCQLQICSRSLLFTARDYRIRF